MPTCRKCGSHFPNKKIIDGKQRTLNGRCYCLDCSPFKLHNTRKLEEQAKDGLGVCSTCGRSDTKRKIGYKVCYSCINRAREHKKSDQVYAVVGETCWICGYGKGKATRGVMDFHHIGKKSFNISKRNMGQFSWNAVFYEVRKCVLVCCRCHREIHAGIIPKNEVMTLYENKWLELAGNSMAECGPDATEVGSSNLPLPTILEKIVEDQYRATNLCEFVCEQCLKKITMRKSQLLGRRFCSQACRLLANRKVKRPSAEDLIKDVADMTWESVGKKYGVSSNAVRKWFHAYGIEQYLNVRGRLAHLAERLDHTQKVAGPTPAPTTI